MSTQTTSDPLIDEVRQRRQELYARYGNDLEKVAEAIRQLEAKHPERVFNRAKQLPATQDKDDR